MTDEVSVDVLPANDGGRPVAVNLGLVLENGVNGEGWDQPPRLFSGISSTPPPGHPPAIAVLFREQGLHPHVVVQPISLILAGIAGAMRNQATNPFGPGCVLLCAAFEVLHAPPGEGGEAAPEMDGQEARILVLVDRLGQSYVVHRMRGGGEPAVGSPEGSEQLVAEVVAGLLRTMIAVIDIDNAGTVGAVGKTSTDPVKQRRPVDPRAN